MTTPSYVGRYSVRGEIARGGFATVLLAWDEELRSSVALKVLDPRGGGADEALRDRFLEEARLLRRIRSPNVVTVHDVGRLPDGRPYFVMDLADRGTLADLLSRSRGAGAPGAIGPRGVAAVVDALADGLGAVHSADIVHRDVKPANILLQSLRAGSADEEETTLLHAGEDVTGGHGRALAGDAFEDVRILVGDFGIAAEIAQGEAGDVLHAGTPAYQSPEQIEAGRPVTAASDIYSATAVLHHLVCGLRPPPADRRESAFAAVPVLWREVVRQGMAQEPSARFASIDAWRAAIHDVLSEAAATGEGERDPAGGFAAGEVSAECPYRGLGAYQPEDADRFYGREALTDELVRRLHRRNVLVVGGASGSGKSSLVRAGLIPALKAEAARRGGERRFALMTPGRDALAELHFHLVGGVTRRARGEGPDRLAERPALARRLAHPEGTEPPLTLFIDQFEELFTLSPPDQAAPFVEALAAMTDPADSRVRLVLAVRADYYVACARFPWLADRITDNQVMVGPMSAAELRRAIVEPARRAGLYLERNLVDAIVDDAGAEPGSLPLVAHALVETWARRKGATLTLEGYRAAGGVAGAIAQTAEEIFEERFGRDERETTRRLFLRLVSPGEGAGDTRRVVEREEIDADAEPDITRRVVERLTGARLLTVDRRHVEIAHEALLRSWPRLREWIDQARDDLRLRQRLMRHAQEWEAGGRDADLLLRGAPLTAAVAWRQDNTDQGGPLIRAFVDASVAEKTRVEALESQRLERSRRIRLAAVTALGLLAAGATAASVFAWRGYREAHVSELVAAEANRQVQARFALALGAVADGLAAEDPRLALFLASEAAARAGPEGPGLHARTAMIAARRALADDDPHPLGAPIPVGDALSLALSGSGAFAAIGGRDGSIVLVDAALRRPVGAPAEGHDGGVEDLEFSPDGRALVSAGDDGTLRLWPIGDGFLGRGEVLGRLSDIMWGLAFDASGAQVATASEDQTVRVWNLRAARPAGEPVATGVGDALAVAFDPTGEDVIAGTGAGAVFGWRIRDGAETIPPILHAHTSDVWGVRFAPDGRSFATVSSDGSSAQFSYPEGRRLGRAFGGDEPVYAVAFVKNGRALIGGGDDGRLHVRDLAGAGPSPAGAAGAAGAMATTAQHAGRITRVAVADDGKLAASLGRDHALRFWTLYDPVPLATELLSQSPAIKGVAIGRDPQGATTTAVADSSGAVLVWTPGAGRAQVLEGHAREVWALALSPDGRRLVSADRTGEVRLWDLRDGRAEVLRGIGAGAGWWTGFSPDGRRIYVVTDGAVDAMDLETGRAERLMEAQDEQFTRGALSPSGRTLAATTTSGRVRLLDLAGGGGERRLKVIDDVLWSAAFSADETLLAAAGSDETVSVWDLASGERKLAAAGHPGGATDVAFLADRATLAVVDRRGGLHLRDVADGGRLAPPIQAHSGASWRLAAPRLGPPVFLTGGDDGKVRLWDMLDVARNCRLGAAAMDDGLRREYFGEAGLDLACERGPAPASAGAPAPDAADPPARR